jgi:hypothetical protein
MSLKERYHNFRQWQLNPFDHRNHNQQKVKCANCGTEFDTNFCPMCGQKAGVGPIGWNTVRQGVMMLWGMDSRSLGYSLVQLLLRPGYFISDYLKGRRQVSFPPIKMLLLVAIIELIAESVFGPPYEAQPVKNRNNVLEAISNWMDANPGWGMLFTISLLIFPTWLFFRYSPKHPKHTLPEGFFIQAFMSTIMLLLAALVVVTKELWLLAITPFIYIIAYHQLFGYRWWPTIWRVLLSFFCFIIAFGSIDLGLKVFVYDNKAEMVNFIASIIMLVIFTLIGFLIGKRTGKKRAKRENVDESVTSVTA